MDQYVAMVTDMLRALPVTIYFKQLFLECNLQYTLPPYTLPNFINCIAGKFRGVNIRSTRETVHDKI